MEEQKRTQYVIKATDAELYASGHLDWVDLELAFRFDTMTFALLHATVMGYPLDAYTIEPV